MSHCHPLEGHSPQEHSSVIAAPLSFQSKDNAIAATFKASSFESASLRIGLEEICLAVEVRGVFQATKCYRHLGRPFLPRNSALYLPCSTSCAWSHLRGDLLPLQYKQACSSPANRSVGLAAENHRKPRELHVVAVLLSSTSTIPGSDASINF
jgi:hypothetical protein